MLKKQRIMFIVLLVLGSMVSLGFVEKQVADEYYSDEFFDTPTASNFIPAIAPAKSSITVTWKASTPTTDCSGPTGWNQINFNDSSWSSKSLPDIDAVDEDENRMYRGRFNWNTSHPGLKLHFASDDGVEVYINGYYLGEWGGLCTDEGCVNDPEGKCDANTDVDPISISRWLVEGTNVIGIFFFNGPRDSYLDCFLVDAPEESCPSDGQYCNGREYWTGTQCSQSGNPCTDDGNYCNGDEYCSESADACYSTGSPCVSDGVFCNGPEVCIESSDTCVSNGNPCTDDNQFCNGMESCDEESKTCLHSGNPCSPDALWCNGDEYCDEFTDSCKSAGNPCDDGLFCNGQEICVEAGRQCVASSNPCPIDDGIFCNGTETEICNEARDECEHTGDPCPDDNFWCNGYESCNEYSGTCNHSGNPCAPDLCSEKSNSCYPATADDDDNRDLDDDDEDAQEKDKDTPQTEDEDTDGVASGGCCS